MKTASQKSALHPVCAFLSAVFFFCAVCLFFLLTLQLRFGGDFGDPARRTPAMEALLGRYDAQLQSAFAVFYRSGGEVHTECPAALLPQNTNLRLIARDQETGKLLLRTSTQIRAADDALLHETHTVNVTFTPQDALMTQQRNVNVEYYLPAELTVRDSFVLLRALMRTANAAQDYLWAGGVLCTAAALLLAIRFLRSAYREGGLSRSTRRLFREFPPDLLLVSLLPFSLLCLSQLRGHDAASILTDSVCAQQADAWFLLFPLACTGLFYALLGWLGVSLFSLRRYGSRGMLSYLRYERAPFTRVTLPAVIFLQFVKTAACVLYGQAHPRAVLLCLVLEKAALLPVLYRCLREIRTIREETEAVAQGDLSQPIGLPHMYKSLRDHADDVDSIAQRISVSADEYIRSGRFKAELVTNLSHDIKTPLTSIINYAALLQNEALPTQDRERYIAVLHRHAQRLSRLVEDLTQVGDMQSGTIEAHCAKLDLASLVVQSALGFEERLQKQKITMRFSVPPTPVFVQADNRLLWRVADNLMNNICKYSSPDTEVTISVSRQAETACAVYENVPAAPLEKTGDALMERFVRADNSRHTEGSGLGLSIARSLLQLQGGTLEIEPQSERFVSRVLLPLYDSSKE